MTRKTVSLITLFSFLALILSSIALYIIPGGRNAAPEQLIMLGIHKSTWKDIHITGGFLFIGIALWHTWLNMRALASYMKKSASLSWRSALPLCIAIAVTAFVYAGTVNSIEPMRSVLTLAKPGAKPAASSTQTKPVALSMGLSASAANH